MAARVARRSVMTLKTFKAQRDGEELFVKRISWVTGASELRDHFSQFGKIRNITLSFDLRTGLHKGFAFILFENNDFYENIKKFKGKHVIDDEEVICVLAGERKSLLLTDANATTFDSKNSSGMDISKGNSDNEVGKVQFIRNEKNVKEKEIKHGNNPKIISTNSVDFQDSKKRTKETSLSQKLPKIDEWKGRSEKNSLFEKVANMKLTDLVRENEGGNEMYKKINVRPWNSSHVSVTRNGFSGRNNSSNRSFRVSTVETVKQKYFKKGIEFKQSVGSSASSSGQSTS